MSIKNLNKRIIITRLDTGDKEVIHDYFKIPNSIRDTYLMTFINSYIENEIPITINIGYNI